MDYRKITEEDYPALYEHIIMAIDDHQNRGNKEWFKYLDYESVLAQLYLFETYIVGEKFLVCYNVGTPWYASADITFLEEKLVLRISDEGGDFSIVPSFLEERAIAHGAVMVGVGTAFSLSDRAMSKLYSGYGFTPAAVTLTKETNGRLVRD